MRRHPRSRQGTVSSAQNETNLDMLQKLLSFASIVEIGTGLALLIDPAIVVTLLLGADVAGVGVPLGRCFGIALVALGLACWPSGPNARSDSPAFRAMLVYNVLIALFLVYLFLVGHFRGVLLWPGVALHAVVALMLVWSWRTGRPTKVTAT